MIVTAVLAAGCSTRPPEGEPWQLTVGDYWYATTVGPNVTAEARTDILAVEQFRGIPAVRTHISAIQNFPNVTVLANTTSWSRAGDLATIETVSYSRTWVPENASVPPLQANARTAFDPPCKGIRFPLTVASTWARRCEADITVDGPEEQRREQQDMIFRYRVQGRETITVPAGTFDSFVVAVEHQGTLSYQWISMQACGVVKAVVYQGTQQIVTELAEYRCQAAQAALL